MNRHSTYLSLGIALFFGCGGDSSRMDVEPSAGRLTLPPGNVVDLTYSYNEETVYWPTADGFQREITAEGVTEQGYYYSSGTFTSAEHGGTHLDAPVHFSESGLAVDEISLDRLMGNAVVIDVSEHSTANPDYQITTEDLQDWETEHGPVPDGSIVFFRTGYGEFWPDRTRYMGTEERGAQAITSLHFPGLSSNAAKWLLENRSILAVGIDTPSIDYGQSQQFATHQVLAAENIPALENVANLDELPEEGSLVVALPMKIEGGSGGPVRIVAFVP